MPSIAVCVFFSPCVVGDEACQDVNGPPRQCPVPLAADQTCIEEGMGRQQSGKRLCLGGRGLLQPVHCSALPGGGDPDFFFLALHPFAVRSFSSWMVVDAVGFGTCS